MHRIIMLIRGLLRDILHISSVGGTGMSVTLCLQGKQCSLVSDCDQVQGCMVHSYDEYVHNSVSKSLKAFCLSYKMIKTVLH